MFILPFEFQNNTEHTCLAVNVHVNVNVDKTLKFDLSVALEILIASVVVSAPMEINVCRKLQTPINPSNLAPKFYQQYC